MPVGALLFFSTILAERAAIVRRFRQVNFSRHCNERDLDFSPHWCRLWIAGEFSLGRH